MNPPTRLSVALIALTSIVLPRITWAENEIGFVETFALAADREKALAELVPGSEDYFCYHALHDQHTRNEPRYAEIR